MNRGQPLLGWQWSLYPDNHRARRNLIIHILTVPLFQAGGLAILISPFLSGWLALGGVVAMAFAMALQGVGHRGETVPPVPFAGPFDAISRIFVEQWITFPRYVLSGRFATRWRAESGDDDAKAARR